LLRLFQVLANLRQAVGVTHDSNHTGRWINICTFKDKWVKNPSGFFQRIRKLPAQRILRERVRVPDTQKVALLFGAMARTRLIGL